jgi:hypothetical protein
MKIFLLVFLLVSANAFAGVAAECHLTEGVFKNSSKSLTDLKFETVVDVFTLNNARTISMTFEGENLRFTRSDIEINRNTKLIYHMKERNNIRRVAYLNIDRTPKHITKDREFYGNMILTDELPAQATHQDTISVRRFVYNFYCRF